MAWNDEYTAILLMVILTFLIVFAGIMGAVLFYRHKKSGLPLPFQNRAAAFLPAGLFPLIAFYVLFHMFFTTPPGVYGPAGTASPLYVLFQLVSNIFGGILFIIILYIVVTLGLFHHRKEKHPVKRF